MQVCYKSCPSTRENRGYHERYAQSTLGQPKGSSSKVKKVLGVCWDTVNDELLFEFNYLFDHGKWLVQLAGSMTP